MNQNRKLAVAILQELSSLFLAGEVSGRAYARVAESLIATFGLEEDDPEFEDFGLTLALYSTTGEPGTIGDAELRRVVEAKLSRMPR